MCTPSRISPSGSRALLGQSHTYTYAFSHPASLKHPLQQVYSSVGLLDRCECRAWLATHVPAPSGPHIHSRHLQPQPQPQDTRAHNPFSQHPQPTRSHKHWQTQITCEGYRAVPATMFTTTYNAKHAHTQQAAHLLLVRLPFPPSRTEPRAAGLLKGA